MAYDQAIRTEVRSAYVHKQLSLEHVAAMHSVPYNTVRRWKKDAEDSGDDWDVARNAAHLADGGLGSLTDIMINQFAVQSQAIMDQMTNDEKMSAENKVNLMAKLSDSYAKTVAAAGKSDKKISALSIAIKVLVLLRDYISEHHPDYKAVFINDIIEPFGAHVAKELDNARS